MTSTEKPEETALPGPLAQVLRVLEEEVDPEEDRKYSTFRALVSASLLGELKHPSRRLLLGFLRDLDPMVEDWARTRVHTAALDVLRWRSLSAGTALGLAWEAMLRLLEWRYVEALSKPKSEMESTRDLEIVEQVFGQETSLALLRPRPWLEVYESLLEPNQAEALMRAAWHLGHPSPGDSGALASRHRIPPLQAALGLGFTVWRILKQGDST